MVSAEPGSAPAPKRNPGLLLGVFAVAAIFIIVVASFGLGLFPSFGVSSTSSTSSLVSPESVASSLGVSGAPLSLCSALTPSQLQTNARVANGSAGSNPSYDEQLLLGFERNFTSSMAYNVTIRAQNDSSGYWTCLPPQRPDRCRLLVPGGGRLEPPYRIRRPGHAGVQVRVRGVEHQHELDCLPSDGRDGGDAVPGHRRGRQSCSC